MKRLLKIILLTLFVTSAPAPAKALRPNSYTIKELKDMYGDSIVVGDLVYRWLKDVDNDEKKVFIDVAHESRMHIEKIECPTVLTHEGQDYTVAGIAHLGFADCINLKKVVLPSSIRSIGLYAFMGCANLGPSITIPASMLWLSGHFHFIECPNLVELRFEKNETELHCEGFDYASGFIDIPKLVTGRDIKFDVRKIPVTSATPDSISCLRHTKELAVLDGTDVTKLFKFTRWHVQKLTIGKDVTGLPTSLANHKKLSSIILMAETPPPCPAFTDEQYATISLTVPLNSLEAYRQADGWKNFLTIKESGIDAPAIEPSERTLTGRYDLQGRHVADGYRGLVIERYSDGTAAKKIIGR